MRSLLFGLSVVTAVSAQQTAWGQCGGLTWKGAITCVNGYVCTFSSEYYSQCIPGTAAPSSSTAPTTIATTSKTSMPTTLATTTSSGGAVPTGSDTGPGTTLQTGYYWIRAVAAPNFHKYLQTKPIYLPGTAILESYTTAGQFAIVDGQLVELLTPTTFLYANVIASTVSGATKLAVEFKTAKNTYGTFAWSGDALQWSVAGLSRPNLSAWLVCEGQSLWVNLGSYGYMTPAGCVDQTVSLSL
ncbi:carbohydrate-binding module family 1 protein [Cadophora sp. DSE1049]|nr:carbohydrate-binding module family 1 protein [Cadophora sp. DSE1049]